ncbi:unnamed protein product [Cylicocyclus nassatus]|uniref:CID domain-containing protein n=1 Tax=Cylicocyclus nassatus TaxID=53992 RepID=A0AA36M580_CYLNA|nr:unnamed protein product [Cylicocyclus nassatus]
MHRDPSPPWENRLMSERTANPRWKQVPDSPSFEFKTTTVVWRGMGENTVATRVGVVSGYFTYRVVDALFDLVEHAVSFSIGAGEIMSGFSEVAMRERLAKLRPQQDSINTLSLWLMHHHRHMDDIVQIWLKEVRKETNSSQIVNLLYVANDVIQNSRKKNPEFMTKFYGVLEPAFRHAAKISGPELDKAMIKTLNVWRDRQIYNEEQLAPLDAVIKRRKSSSNSGSNSHLAHVHAPLIPELFPASAAAPPPEYDSESVSTNVTEVLESLRKLDYPPSADAEVRHKIASYSEMIATPQSLDTIRNSAEAKKLLAEIDEAEPLVKEYCQRLADEMLERRNLQKLFDDMIVNVRATVDLHETLLKEVRRKEERARNDLAEVRKAFDSLPDLTEVTEDAPLPSLENLFDL